MMSKFFRRKSRECPAREAGNKAPLALKPVKDQSPFLSPKQKHNTPADWWSQEPERERRATLLAGGVKERKHSCPASNSTLLPLFLGTNLHTRWLLYYIFCLRSLLPITGVIACFILPPVILFAWSSCHWGSPQAWGTGRAGISCLKNGSAWNKKCGSNRSPPSSQFLAF